MRDTRLFSFRVNGGIERWMERGTRQLAVTNVSRKQAVLCADVKLALGQLAVLLPPHQPQTSPPRIIMMNWISLSPLLCSRSHSKARKSMMSICLYISEEFFVLYLIKMNKYESNNRHKMTGLLTDWEWVSFASIFNYWMQGLVISGAFVSTHSCPSPVKRHSA